MNLSRGAVWPLAPPSAVIAPLGSHCHPSTEPAHAAGAQRLVCGNEAPQPSGRSLYLARPESVLGVGDFEPAPRHARPHTQVGSSLEREAALVGLAPGQP